MIDKPEFSKTVLGDAANAGLDLNDPEVLELARERQRRKIREEKEAEEKRKNTFKYKITEKLKESAPGMVVAVVSFLGMTIGGVITAIVKNW